MQAAVLEKGAIQETQAMNFAGLSDGDGADCLGGADVLCLSHLRWDFVYQRPQHLLSRWARERRVFFVEEPIWDGGPWLEVRPRDERLWVAVPHLPGGLSEAEVEAHQHALLDQLLAEQAIERPIVWFYTPMALGFADHLDARVTVYDCMDELSNFHGAPPLLREREGELLRRADVVFTGGQSLYEAKREQHPNIHPFPSSIDRAHFAQARTLTNEPDDQATIPRPRLGFFGVIDERLDVALLDAVAAARPDWQLVIVGPVVKIDPATLPQRPNIHFLGGKSYADLPAYLAGWDVALLPFALNDATRFISPTKTPEYLAGGKPVVSTPIRDVVRPYGEQGLVHIGDTAEAWVRCIEQALAQRGDAGWLERVDPFLAQTSWDQSWARMKEQIEQAACAAGSRAG